MGEVYRLDSGRSSTLFIIIGDMEYEMEIIPFIGIIDSTTAGVKKYLRKNMADGNGVILQLPLTSELVKMSRFELIESTDDNEVESVEPGIEPPIKIRVVEI